MPPTRPSLQRSTVPLPFPRFPVRFSTSDGGDRWNEVEISNMDRYQYKKHWLELNELEWKAEEDQFEERLRTWPTHRRKIEGLCLTGLLGSEVHSRRFKLLQSSKDSITIQFNLPESTPPKGGRPFLRRLPLNVLQHGDAIRVTAVNDLASRQDNEADVRTTDGYVVLVAPTHITAEFKEDCTWFFDIDFYEEAEEAEEAAGAEEPKFQLDRIASKVAYERTKKGIEDFTGVSSEAPLILRYLMMKSEMGAYLPLSDSRQEMNVAIPSRLLEELNESQRSAIRKTIGTPLTLIQGPPGCGKTAVACAILEATTSTLKANGAWPVLACADSNVAVDQLLKGLLARNVRALRLGPSSDSILQNATVEAEVQWRVNLKRKKINDFRAQFIVDGKRVDMDYADRLYLNKMYDDLREFEKGQFELVLKNECDVLCATLVATGSPVLNKVQFPLVLVDECTQASESRCCIALAKVSGQVVLVGDQMQLPPVCVSEKAKDKGLGISLFERMLPIHSALKHTGAIASSRLTMQYRMHPMIRRFPSDAFYDGSLEDAGHARGRKPAFGSSALIFLDVADGEEETALGTSKRNMAEVVAVREALRNLTDVRGGISPQDIGVISPYAGQIMELKSALKQFEGIEIKTVDGFQGCEKEVIVFSCVRSNKNKQIGFLADPRRLNVAITRAKRGLLVLGHRETLQTNELWAAFLKYVDDSNSDIRVHGARGGGAHFDDTTHQHDGSGDLTK